MPTELSFRTNRLKSRKRWEKHFRSWNQHGQRAQWQEEASMKNPKMALRGWSTGHGDGRSTGCSGKKVPDA